MQGYGEILVGERFLFVFSLDESFDALFGCVMGDRVRTRVGKEKPERKNPARAGDDFFFHGS